MVLKKDSEVQEGWKGRILPSDLVQRAKLSGELENISKKETRLSEISAEYSELIESLSMEDKETDIVNEAGDSFNAKGITAKLKELKNSSLEEDKNLRLVLQGYTNLSKEEKDLKKEIATLKLELHSKTKEVIEGLSDEEADRLLYLKWIVPITSEIASIPDGIVADLEKKVLALAQKYEETLLDIEDEISKTGKVISEMLDDLDGSEFDLAGISMLKELLL